MTAGEKLYKLNSAMEDVFSDAAVVQEKIDKENKMAVPVGIAAVLSLIGSIAALSFGFDDNARGDSTGIYWLILGGILMVFIFGVFGKAMSSQFSNSLLERSFSSRYYAAQAKYRQSLEDMAEAHGIDPGTIKSRERKGEENTLFTATRDNVPVSLTVEKQDGEMLVKINGEPLHEEHLV